MIMNANNDDMTSNSTSNADAPQPVTFWHNGICFYRRYDRNPLNNRLYATDTAIVGDSFYISHNAKEKRIKEGRYSADGEFGEAPHVDGHFFMSSGNKLGIGTVRRRFSDKAATRLMELSDDSGAPISEIYARLMTERHDTHSRGIPQVDLSRSYKAVKESLSYIPPALTCAPDDGFPPPSFPYTGYVIFIGNGWKMRHLLGHSNVAFS